MRSFSLILFTVLIALALSACGSGADAPARAVESYLEALVAKDANRLTTLSCGEWEDDALIELYRRLRPGDPPTRDNATSMLENLFFNDRRYDLARVGRYKLNERLHRDKNDEARPDSRILTQEDLVEIIHDYGRQVGGIDDASMQVNFTTVSGRQAADSLRLFAEKVIPRLAGR